eukprot:2009541-Prymnesium_polylepis.2
MRRLQERALTVAQRERIQKNRRWRFADWDCRRAKPEARRGSYFRLSNMLRQEPRGLRVEKRRVESPGGGNSSFQIPGWYSGSGGQMSHKL